MESEPGTRRRHLPSPTLWPIGFAIGLAVLLVGLVVSWVGGRRRRARSRIVFGLLWVRDLSHAHAAAKAEPPPAPRGCRRRRPRRRSAEAAEPSGTRATSSSRARPSASARVIGGLVMLPPLGCVVAVGHRGPEVHDVDLGPLANFPEGQFMITTFVEDPSVGEVSRRTAYIRNNGLLGRGPAELHDHLEPLRAPRLPGAAERPGRRQADAKEDRTGQDVLKLTPAMPAGFGCPCHGGQYDTEGNRIAGPPVRALDRYEFSIINGRLVLG